MSFIWVTDIYNKMYNVDTEDITVKYLLKRFFPKWSSVVKTIAHIIIKRHYKITNTP
jgi:hypothetical protein